jgi:hypothetical protein
VVHIDAASKTMLDAPLLAATAGAGAVPKPPAAFQLAWQLV